MINVIRWVCVIPAAYLGYYLALIGGMASIVLAESFCPPEDVVSGLCTSDYMRLVEKILFAVFPAIAAILVVLLPTLIAPSKKVAVATTCYAVGSIAAIYMCISLEEWVVLGLVLTSGGITLYSIYAHQQRQQNA